MKKEIERQKTILCHDGSIAKEIKVMNYELHSSITTLLSRDKVVDLQQTIRYQNGSFLELSVISLYINLYHTPDSSTGV